MRILDAIGKVCAAVIVGTSLAVASIQPADAFSINPTFLDMKPTGSAARGTVTVTNSSTSPMAIEAVMERLFLDENGNVTEQPAEDDFLIFPPQALIAPLSSQTFRVQWIGEPALAQGRFYSLSMNQVLPEDDTASSEGEQTAIKVRLALAFSAIINMPAISGAPTPRSARRVSQACKGAGEQSKRGSAIRRTRIS